MPPYKLIHSVIYVCGLPPIKIDFNVICWLQKHDSEFSANRNQYHHEWVLARA